MWALSVATGDSSTFTSFSPFKNTKPNFESPIFDHLTLNASSLFSTLLKLITVLSSPLSFLNHCICFAALHSSKDGRK